MNREEFFNWLYYRFEKHWASKDHFKALKEDYKLVLPDTTDFKEIHKRTVFSYSDTFKPPSPEWFNELRIQINNDKSQENNRYKGFNDGVACPPEYKARVQELAKKLGKVI